VKIDTTPLRVRVHVRYKYADAIIAGMLGFFLGVCATFWVVHIVAMRMPLK